MNTQIFRPRVPGFTSRRHSQFEPQGVISKGGIIIPPLPDEWIRRVNRYLKGEVQGRSTGFSGRIDMPQWSKDKLLAYLCSTEATDLDTMSICEGHTLIIDSQKRMRLVCIIYLDIFNKTQWPLLLGLHPVMDQVIGQAFKKEK